jgi:hypothetical protein
MLLISESYGGKDIMIPHPMLNQIVRVQTKKLKPRRACFLHLLLQILIIFGLTQTAIVSRKHKNEV